MRIYLLVISIICIIGDIKSILKPITLQERYKNSIQNKTLDKTLEQNDTLIVHYMAKKISRCLTNITILIYLFLSILLIQHILFVIVCLIYVAEATFKEYNIKQCLDENKYNKILISKKYIVISDVFDTLFSGFIIIMVYIK